MNSELEKILDTISDKKEKICCECGEHITASGYIICLCCLHGSCSRVPQKWQDEIAELERQAEALGYMEQIGVEK